MALRVLSAGAAKGLVLDLASAFTAETGIEIDAFFGAVGTVKEKFLADDACDTLILTAPLVEHFITQDLLLANSQASLGTVHTGIVVPVGHKCPDISTIAAFRASLLVSKGIYMPDGERSTAGIHFMKVLHRLGIEREIRRNLKPFPTGDEAMRHLAEAVEENALGCTQITEIKYTKGLNLVGLLPKEYDLSTVYEAAASRRSAEPEASRQLVELLSGNASRGLRISRGFETES